MKKSFIDLFLIVVNYLYTISLKNVEIKGTHISDNFWRGHMNENLFIYFQILVHEMSRVALYIIAVLFRLVIFRITSFDNTLGIFKLSK
jgi:hypothetical protein